MIPICEVYGSDMLDTLVMECVQTEHDVHDTIDIMSPFRPIYPKTKVGITFGCSRERNSNLRNT